MQSVGVRELKQRTSEILREVEERGEEVRITRRGQVIARLVPVPTPAVKARAQEVWAEMDRLAEQIAARWPEGVSATEAVAEQRR
jgi:prevent-host-death family protein